MARWSALHPWRAIAGWLVFVVLCVLAGSAVGTNRAGSAGHIGRILAKLDLRDRSAAIIFAYRSGLTAPGA